MFQSHINVLKHSDVPFVLGLDPKHAGAIPHSEQVPWINVEIVITHGHPMKGFPGVVKDVLCNQPTPSGLQVVVQITSFNPNAPFRNLTVDYDCVVEARYSYFGPVEQPLTLTNSCGVKLHQFAWPKATIFMPRVSEPPKSFPALIRQPPLDSPGNTTPIPESSLSSSPAWDPSSRTPQPNLHLSPSQSEDALLDPPDHSCASSTFPSQPVDPEHVLLDPRLVNVNLRVVINGGQYEGKEITAFVMSTEGRLSIQRRKYRTLEYLSPECVTPKYPNPKRENGLLVVIRGEHFGKYVRRIYHRFVGDTEEAIAILAVVSRVAGGVDTLTVDRLEMAASHLCVCEEPIEDRKRNDLLMQPLREKAREQRAK